MTAVISSDPAVRSGAPVIAATLVSVQDVICEIWLGATPREAARRLGVSEADAWAALAYAADWLEDELARAAQ